MRPNPPHISESYELGPDIFRGLFDNVFLWDQYRCWLLETNPWQLRIVGGPGSGKTTLVAVIAEKLKETYDRNDDAVTSIFIKPCMQWNETSRAEVLLSLLRQLGSKSTKPGEEDSPLIVRLAAQIEQARQHQAIIPIEAIYKGLEERLKSLKRAFLLVDGIDQCGWFSDTSLESDIERLQNLGLKVLLTSRTLAFNQEEWDNAENSCDSCQRCPLRVYWRCESGLHPEPFILCQDCHGKSRSCPYPKCQSVDSYIQPYHRRRMEMWEALAGTMKSYVTWDIENEHGDLGLGDNAIQKPPLSMLGAKLRDSRRTQAAQWFRNTIVEQADRNPAQARLRLDGAHENMSAIDDMDALPGQLPVALTSLFEAGIRGIQKQAPPDAELGLNALALWRLGYDSEDMLLSGLEAKSIPEDLCTIERVLHATRGYLSPALEGDRPIVEYCYGFGTYVKGGYSELVKGVVEK